MTDETTAPKTEEIDAAKAPADPKKGGKEKSGVPGAVWMGTAVGVGSAALVAALMYTKRRK